MHSDVDFWVLPSLCNDPKDSVRKLHQSPKRLVLAIDLVSILIYCGCCRFVNSRSTDESWTPRKLCLPDLRLDLLVGGNLPPLSSH